MTAVVCVLLGVLFLVGGSAATQKDFPFSIDAVIKALEQSNFVVDRGVWKVFNVSHCQFTPTCFGNNPSSPYVSFAFPDTAGWNATDLIGGGFLQPSQTVIFVGIAPPPVRYYGFTPYLFTRWRRVLKVRSLMFDSLTDTLNMNTISSSSDGIIAVYSTPDITVSSTIAGILGTVLPKTSLNALPLPGQLLNLGMSDTADAFGYLVRFAFFQNETAGLEYINSPPGYVLLATPRTTPSPANLFPYPKFRPYATSPNENFLNNSLNSLVTSVISAFPNTQHLVTYGSDPEAQVNYQNGFTCINLTLNCNGDNRDARYVGVKELFLNNSRTFFFVVGVIHKTTKKATYSNVAFTYEEKALGVAAIADDAMLDSAQRYLPNDTNNVHLYAIKVARACGNTEKFCVPIPVNFPGVPLDAAMSVIERVYVEPSSNVAPAQDTILLPIVIQFWP